MNLTWVLYDASCPFCIGTINAFKATLEKRNCKIKPLQNETVMNILGVEESDEFPEMKVIGNNRKVYGGARGVDDTAVPVYGSADCIVEKIFQTAIICKDTFF